MKQNKRETGQYYERQAAEHLSGLGYEILQKNYYCPFGEIDIIASHQGYLVFVEVKYRKDTAFGTPQESVSLHKQKKVIGAAKYYCMKNGLGESTPIRFDVVAILKQQITVIQNAFEL